MTKYGAFASRSKCHLTFSRYSIYLFLVLFIIIFWCAIFSNIGYKSSILLDENIIIWYVQEEVAKEFGIPIQFQRYWLWAKRQNHTYRPNRPLTPMEEAQSVCIYLSSCKGGNTSVLKAGTELELENCNLNLSFKGASTIFVQRRGQLEISRKGSIKMLLYHYIECLKMSSINL